MANDRPPDGEPPARQPGYRPPENRPTPAQQQQSEPAASRLSIDVSPRYIRLQPGEVVTASIKVRNMGPVVDEITLTPRGEAGAWITIAPDTLNIYPSTEAEATIRFAPPRASRPPAGLFAFEIAVNSDRQPDSSTVYRGSVELGSYDNLSAAATGTTYVTGRRDAILPIKVRNLGNRPTNVQVSAADLPGAAVVLSAPAFALEPAARRRCGRRSGPSPVSCLARRASFRYGFGQQRLLAAPHHRRADGAAGALQPHAPRRSRRPRGRSADRRWRFRRQCVGNPASLPGAVDTPSPPSIANETSTPTAGPTGSSAVETANAG